jgi:hypothetical protein
MAKYLRNMNEIFTLPNEFNEYEDPDDFLNAAVASYDEPIPVSESWFPTEYVVFYTGPRGSSKTLQLARHSLMGLAQGLKVFTNLELYPEKIGIKILPNPVNLEFLLSFDESLTDAIIMISEIDTWFDRMRETSTGNRLGGKFLQQLRKKGLRIGFDTQDYLPGSLMRQVDKLVFCHDFFFTDWGRERGLRKGTTFYYDCMDYSGIFTGHRGRMWHEALHHAEKIWPLFNTNKIHDPLEFARKVKVVGGEWEFNADSGELYAASEKGRREWETNRKANSAILKMLIASYKVTGFFDLVMEHDGIEELDNSYIFSADKIRKALASTDEQQKAILKDVYEELNALAAQGQYARFGPRHKSIELAKPITEET